MDKILKVILLPLKILSVLGFISLVLCYVSPYIHPDTLPILPFFGLSYPIIIICNLVALVFWTILKSRWAIYSIFMILLGGNLHFRTLAITFFTAKKRNTELKILTYNVRLFDVYNPDFEQGRNTRNQIFAYLRKENPDVVCMQEFYRQDNPTRFTTIDSIFAVMGTSIFHERSAHKQRGRQNFGIALFSKYPMIAKGDVMFDTQSKEDYNYCIYADIVKNNDTFRVYNIHLQSIRLESDYYNDDPNDPMTNLANETGLRYLMRKLSLAFHKRASQSRRVAEHVNTSPYSTIVCGDFNDTPMSYTYNQFNRRLVDAFRNTSTGIGATYIGKLPAGRIDYIFHSPDLASYDFHIQEEELSDHRAISCTISK